MGNGSLATMSTIVTRSERFPQAAPTDDTTCLGGTSQADPRLPHRCPIVGSTEKPV